MRDPFVLAKAAVGLPIIIGFFLILGSVQVASAKAKGIELKPGTMVYVENASKREVFLYLNDSDNTVDLLADDVSSPNSIFNGSKCDFYLRCTSLRSTLNGLHESCKNIDNSSVGVCAASQEMLYEIYDAGKGKTELLIGDRATIMFVVPILITVNDLAHRDAAVAFRQLDPAFTPESASAWENESRRLAAEARQQRQGARNRDKQASESEYECLTSLKQGQSVEALMQCSNRPHQVNSDLQTDQLVFEIPVYSENPDLGLLGTREVRVHIEKSTHTVQNVLWSSEIKRP